MLKAFSVKPQNPNYKTSNKTDEATAEIITSGEKYAYTNTIVHQFFFPPAPGINNLFQLQLG